MTSSLELHRAFDLLKTHAIASLSTQLVNVSQILNLALDGKGKPNHSDSVGTFSRIHELVEVLSSQEQAVFGTEFVPWAIQFIPNIPIKFIESAWEQQLRYGLLQLLKQIASSPEAMRPFLEDVMNFLLKILRDDNEENAMLSLHIMIDLHKIHRTVLEPFAQAMVDFVLEAFEAFPETCETIFEVIFTISGTLIRI
jgi:transformation/transcription domain-associated protein